MCCTLYNHMFCTLYKVTCGAHCTITCTAHFTKSHVLHTVHVLHTLQSHMCCTLYNHMHCMYTVQSHVLHTVQSHVLHTVQSHVLHALQSHMCCTLYTCTTHFTKSHVLHTVQSQSGGSHATLCNQETSVSSLCIHCWCKTCYKFAQNNLPGLMIYGLFSVLQVCWYKRCPKFVQGSLSELSIWRFVHAFWPQAGGSKICDTYHYVTQKCNGQIKEFSYLQRNDSSVISNDWWTCRCAFNWWDWLCTGSLPWNSPYPVLITSTDSLSTLTKIVRMMITIRKADLCSRDHKDLIMAVSDSHIFIQSWQQSLQAFA